jgi:hypothetical protein
MLGRGVGVVKVKVNVKFALEQELTPRGLKRHSSTLSLTSTLDASGWSTARSGRFTPWKETRYPLSRRLGVGKI